jgi:hypothetical protein
MRGAETPNFSSSNSASPFLKCIELLVPSFVLRIVRIEHLEPNTARRIHAVFPFADHSFQVPVANLPVERHAATGDVLCIDDALTSTLQDQLVKLLLALDQRKLSQIAPVNPKQIESIECRFLATIQKLIELAVAVAIQANYFTVQNRVCRLQACQCRLEGIKTFVVVFVCRFL